MDKQSIIIGMIGSDNLPRLPAVVVKLIELLGNPRATPHEISSTLSKDADLTANVLRAVNSSYYGLSQKVATIERAVVMLGNKSIKSITVGCVVCGDYGKQRIAGFDPTFFWRHSLFTSTCSRLLAQREKGVDPEEAFLRGLLLNLGAMAMALTLGTKYTSVLYDKWRTMRQVADREQSTFEVNHAEVSAAMIESWRLPATISGPLRFAFSPMEAPEAERGAACVVAVASEAADVIAAAQAGEMERFFDISNTFSDHAGAWLGLNWKDADDLIQNATTAAGDAAELLHINAGEMPDLEKLGKQFELAVHSRDAA